MRRSALSVCALSLLAMALSGAALASHYPLNAIDLTTSKENFALYKAGVTDTEQLLARAAKASDREALSREVGLTVERLTELAQLCDLMSMKGVGMKVARLMHACAITSLSALKTADPVALHACMRRENLKRAISDLVPGPEFLKEWIEATRGQESPLE
jgi:hypothetical protein